MNGVFKPGVPRRLRLRTNLEIYWDFLGWAVVLPDQKVWKSHAPMQAADLLYRGFSTTHQADNSSPELPDYDHVAGTAPNWRDLVGYYTRWGDVKPLLSKLDDRYVIMNAGDELRLRFAEQPAPPAGWVRDYILIGDGWVKDGNLNTTYSKTVCPLPAHKVVNYTVPPGSLEDDPVYKRHKSDWETYHTRYVSPERFRSLLKPELPVESNDTSPNSFGKSNTMKNRVPQIVLAVLFVAALLVTRKYGTNSTPTVIASPQEVKEAMERYGFHLEEAAAKSGIQFTHQSPTLDPKLTSIMPQIASMGAAVSIVDFDKDGWNDLYVCNSGEGSQNHLYRNQHDGTFKDVAPELGIADLNKPGTGVSTGAVWGDYDNDGYPDLLLYKWGKPELFHNDGGKGFTRVTEQAGLPAWGNFNSAIWVDYDRDGKLDLLLCGYFNESIDLWHLKDTRIMPESFEYATNGGRKYLLRNLGNGKFEDVTAKVGLTSTRWTLAACAIDLHGTGYPDLVLANDYGITEVYANQGGKKFVEIGKECGIGAQPKSGMNASYR